MGLRIRHVLAFALVVGISTLGTLAPARARTSRPTAAQIRSRAGLPKLMPIRLSRNGSDVASTGRYRIIDVGTPSGVTLDNPVAFNNTGQIVGEAYDASLGGSDVCEFFDGTRFRTIASEPSVTFCNPAGLNDMDGKHTVDVVGIIGTAYQVEYSTFYSVVDLRSKIIDNSFFTGNPSSIFAGVNATGIALATAFYEPLGGFFTLNPPFLRLPGRRSLALLQPACTTSHTGCGTVAYGYACPFGGCQITDDDSVLLQDANGNFEIVAANGNVRALRLEGNLYPFAPILNNAKQILYAAFTQDLSHLSSRVFDVTTGRTTTIPPVRKKCNALLPLALSNAGHVLGSYTCPTSSDSYYFTYDSKHKTQDVSAQLPAGTGSVQPIAINDAGQILIAIITNAGASHWGILEPPT